MKKICSLIVILLILATACKKENSTKNDDNKYAEIFKDSHGWNIEAKITREDGFSFIPSFHTDYTLYLRKVYTHPDKKLDIFYSYQSRNINSMGVYYLSNDRIIVDADGEMYRAFKDTKELDKELTYSRGPNRVIYLQCSDVKVNSVKTNDYEPIPFIPGEDISDLAWTNSTETSYGSNKIEGSVSPESYLSTKACFDSKRLTRISSGYGYRFYEMNVAYGINAINNTEFVLSYCLDPDYGNVPLIGVSAVAADLTPQYHGSSSTSSRVLFHVPIQNIIPDWNTELQAYNNPLYYQFPENPELLYFVLQNKEQFFLVECNLNYLTFTVKQSYAQPRTTENFSYMYNKFLWIRGTHDFLYIERTREKDGLLIRLLQDGKTNRLQLPLFNSKSYFFGEADLCYDNGKLWFLIYDTESNLYVMSKNY